MGVACLQSFCKMCSVHVDQVIAWMRVQFGKKLHGNRKIARGEAECYLNCCKCNFFPKLHSGPWDCLLIVMTYLH